MAIRLAKKSNGRRRRGAYLPLFAVTNPIAYEAWSRANGSQAQRRRTARPSVAERALKAARLSE
jgi:hypothetical protein